MLMKKGGVSLDVGFLDVKFHEQLGWEKVVEPDPEPVQEAAPVPAEVTETPVIPAETDPIEEVSPVPVEPDPEPVQEAAPEVKKTRRGG